MTELGRIFARLGIEQYLDSFIVEGFDTWETVLDIQEGDLDALNVKLGHRRKLQREIANQRGILEERSIGSPTTEAFGDGGKLSDGSPTPTTQHECTPTEAKRKYRRHPKPDKNAPARPPSAYVIFSNQVREEIRGHSLSFTDIAKLVGDRWQKLSLEDKEKFESQASAAKEKFTVELSQYKKTDASKEYAHYIAEFKLKHAGATMEGKRPKLESDSSSGGGSGRSFEMVTEARSRASMAHTRDISVGSIHSNSYHGSAFSSIGGMAALPPLMMNHGMSTQRSRVSVTRPTNSPPMRSDYRESRIPHALPVHATGPSELHQNRSDMPDLHSRTGELPLVPGQIPMGLPITKTADPAFVSRSPGDFSMPLLQHHSSVSSVNQSDSSGTSNAGPTTPADEPWRGHATEGKAKSAEWPRIYNPLLANNYTAAFNPLPPPQPSDLVPNIIRDPSQRTLPFPAPSSPHGYKPSFPARPGIGTPLPPSESSNGSPSEPHNERNSPLDPSESDAVRALTVLAHTTR